MSWAGPGPPNTLRRLCFYYKHFVVCLSRTTNDDAACEYKLICNTLTAYCKLRLLYRPTCHTRIFANRSRMSSGVFNTSRGSQRFVLIEAGSPIQAGSSIINSSFHQGTVPDQRKISRITPVPKLFPPKHVESDVRPIAVTNTMAKTRNTFCRTRSLANGTFSFRTNRHFKPNMQKIQIATSSEMCIRLT